MNKKWYFTFFINYNTMSIFETSDYNGEGGYNTREEAKAAGSKMLLKDIKKISEEINTKSTMIASQVSTINAMVKELEKLSNE